MLLDLSKSFDVNKAESYFIKLKKDGAKIELKKIEKTRTHSQHGYLHVCLAYFSIETGYEIAEAKDIFADMLPEMMVYEKNCRNFRRSTSSLSTGEMTKLIDLIRATCLNEFGRYVPTSEDYLISKFEIDKEIQYAR